MPEFPISSARILLVSQIQGGQLPSLPPVRYAYAAHENVQHRVCRYCARMLCHV